MKLPTWLTALTTKQRTLLGTIILVMIVGTFYCTCAHADDAVPCAPGCVDGKPVVVKAKAPAPAPAAAVPCAPRSLVRPLLGGGVDYDEQHNLGAHLFTGVQFPTTRQGANWQLQFGPSYMQHNDANATCAVGCRTCATAVPGAGPWGASVSAVVVFK